MKKLLFFLFIATHLIVLNSSDELSNETFLPTINFIGKKVDVSNPEPSVIGFYNGCQEQYQKNLQEKMPEGSFIMKWSRSLLGDKEAEDLADQLASKGIKNITIKKYSSGVFKGHTTITWQTDGTQDQRREHILQDSFTQKLIGEHLEKHFNKVSLTQAQKDCRGWKRFAHWWNCWQSAQELPVFQLNSNLLRDKTSQIRAEVYVQAKKSWWEKGLSDNSYNILPVNFAQKAYDYDKSLSDQEVSTELGQLDKNYQALQQAVAMKHQIEETNKLTQVYKRSAIGQGAAVGILAGGLAAYYCLYRNK